VGSSELHPGRTGTGDYAEQGLPLLSGELSLSAKTHIIQKNTCRRNLLRVLCDRFIVLCV